MAEKKTARVDGEMAREVLDLLAQLEKVDVHRVARIESGVGQDLGRDRPVDRKELC